MQDQTNAIITSLFTDVFQNVVVAGLLIVAIVFLGKFLKKSQIKNGALLYVAGFAYFGKELTITLSSLIKGIYVVITQTTMGGTTNATSSPLVTAYQTLNPYNIWFITALVIVIGIFFIVKPNFNEEEVIVSNNDIVEDEELKITEFKSSDSKEESTVEEKSVEEKTTDK